MARKKGDRQKEIERFDEESELWDSRQLGSSMEHARPVSDEEDKALDEAMGLQLLSFRIQKSAIEKLKQLAKIEGIGYQPLMRQVLTSYVRENQYKLQQLLTPHQASEQAEKLLVQALEFKELIPNLKEMTNERIRVERDYSNALGHANELYRQAYERSHDPVLKNHIKLRLSQISNLLDTELQVLHDRNFGKAV